MDFPYYKAPFQKASPTGWTFLDIIYNPILHKNQKRFAIHACLQQYFLFVFTIKRSLSLPFAFTNCSSINAIIKPIAKIKKEKLRKLELKSKNEIIYNPTCKNDHHTHQYAIHLLLCQQTEYLLNQFQ